MVFEGDMGRNDMKKLAIFGSESGYSSEKFVFVSIEDVNFRIRFCKRDDSSDYWEEEVTFETLQKRTEHTVEVLDSDVSTILEVLGILGRPANLILEEIPTFIAESGRECFGKFFYKISAGGWDPCKEEMRISFTRI
ncbi:MAG: hypothetical protein ACD_7C00086G0009 [uncultured bacterium]|nr:MAG: hypothetical protein ACD_7C00086G0009 [uncultured bacterium]